MEQSASIDYLQSVTRMMWIVLEHRRSTLTAARDGLVASRHVMESASSSSSSASSTLLYERSVYFGKTELCNTRWCKMTTRNPLLVLLLAVVVASPRTEMQATRRCRYLMIASMTAIGTHSCAPASSRSSLVFYLCSAGASSHGRFVSVEARLAQLAAALGHPSAAAALTPTRACRGRETPLRWAGWQRRRTGLAGWSQDRRQLDAYWSVSSPSSSLSSLESSGILQVSK